MSNVNQSKNGKFPNSKSHTMTEKDSSIGAHVESRLDEELSENDLQGIAAAGTPGNDTMKGTDGFDWMRGGDGDDSMDGGDGSDVMFGGAGSDTMEGGGGDDKLDGGMFDRADDVVSGGAGNDSFSWSTLFSGSDSFDGGTGDDEIMLDDMDKTIEDAVASGQISITLTDANGDSVAITDDMFNDNGDLVLPEGINGTLTRGGNVLTFTNVETISTTIDPRDSGEIGRAHV